VQPLRISLNGTALFVPNAQLQQGLLRKALCQPVHVRPEAQVDEETTLPLTASGWLQMTRENPAALLKAASFLWERGLLKDGESIEQATVLLRVAETMERLLDEALKGAGYRLVDNSRPLREGGVRFINGHLEIFFRKALYPHSIFVQWSDGSCGFVVFPGKSGWEGTTLPYAQRFLIEELQAQDAILLDNGGDVRLWYRGQYLVPSSEGREEVRSVLVLTAPRGDRCGDAVVVW
jgi:exopolysaccharide biosynthesis protein